MTAPGHTDRIMRRAVFALGLHQLIAWGSSYYSLGVLGGPIAEDTGWSRSVVYFGFTVSLLAMGIVSPMAGRLIDRHGARTVMSAGTLIVSLGLAAVAGVRSEASYLAAWALLGVGMRLSLYDAAFAALVQVVPSRGPRAISYLTLFGAFASTLFWPLGHQLNQAFGWRATLLAFAAINLVLCLPLARIGLAQRAGDDDVGGAPPVAPTATTSSSEAATAARPLQGRARRLAIALFALVMSLNGFVFGAVTVQLVPLLEAAGLTAAAAAWIAATKGFGQFGGRVVEIVFGRRMRAISVARVAIGVLPWSFVVLLLADGNFHALLVFTLLMGASQGVITIVRGALPLALFGQVGYGAVLGLIATPVLIVNAASPTLIALIVDAWGWLVASHALLGCAAASWLAIEAMALWYRRQG